MLASASPTSSTSPDAAPAESGKPARWDLAILGGGISGLALAAFSVRAGLSVRVFEASERPGGVMDSNAEDGFLFEHGPNTVLDRDPSFDELLEWAGLRQRACRTPMRGTPRYIWHAGRLHEVPSSPISAITTGLISVSGKLRLLREPFIPAVQEDESLARFAERRLGREVYERALVPMVSGTSGGDPGHMSTEFSFPVLKALEREGGSLLRGMLARRRAARAQGPVPPPRPRHMVSFPNGLGELPRAIAARLGESYQSAAPVDSVEPLAEGGFRIRMGSATHEAAQIALCAGADTVARRVAGFAPKTASRLEEVHHCPLIVVGLGVDASNLDLPPGFGFLTTPNSGIRALGAIFSSSIFPGRAPAGAATLTVMFGSDRDPEAVRLSDEEILEQTRRDLGLALRWNGKARVSRVFRWDRAIPQYGLDHRELLAALERAEIEHPGLHFFGNWRGAAAVGERVRLALELATDLAARKRT